MNTDVFWVFQPLFPSNLVDSAQFEDLEPGGIYGETERYKNMLLQVEQVHCTGLIYTTAGS